MRNLILSVLFFFGPVILTFVLRHLVLLLRLWLAARRARPADPEVIDITPIRPHPPSTMFIVIVLAGGLIFAVLAWQRFSTDPEVAGHYVPAQVDTYGNVIPGHFE